MAIELFTSNTMDIDDLVLPPDPISKHLIYYRVKLLLNNNIILGPGQEVLVQVLVRTACIIKD